MPELEKTATELCAYAAHKEVTIQTEERRVEKMYHKYEAAVQNGVETMSCGRVCTIGDHAQLRLRDLLKPSTGMDDQSVYTLDNDRFSPMTEEAEREGLAILANKVLTKNPNSSLNKMMKSAMSEVFHGDSSHIGSNSVPSKSAVDEKISSGIRKIVNNLKNNTVVSSSESPTTPALVHMTHHSWQQLKHILPILITSRSFFIVVIDNIEEIETTNDRKQNYILSFEEDVYRCITCIAGTLSEKASKLYKKLQQKGLNPKSSNRFLCPYPKIVVIKTYTSDEQHTEMKSAIEDIRKWVSFNFSDSAQHNFNTMIMNAVDQSAADIQTQIIKFITSDLNIPTPLSWELFRQMFSYVTKNVQIIQLEKAATIASLCDIATEEFPSVLNFYHEHGAFLYYADVEYLRNIIIIDPKWLQEMLNKIFITDNSSLPMWKRLTTQGILVAPLCEVLWHSDDVENLPTGMVQLLEKYNLAASITIDEEMSDYDGPKYFVPFVLKSKENAQPRQQMVGGLLTAPLHFIFPKIKHLPPGVFTNLIVALASKNIGSFKIDFKSEMCCDQITFWYGNGKRDKVILSANLTSISVVVERLKYCGDEYRARNFWSICQEILSILTTEIETVLQKTFKHIGTKPAFLCTCKSSQGGLPHYVSIDTDTKSTCNTLRCEEDSEYTIGGDYQLWLKMAPSSKEGKLLDSEIDGLTESLQQADQKRLTQALEITSIGSGTHFALLMSGWADATGPDSRSHLVYHLNRLDLIEAAYIINTGEYKKESERQYQCNCK